MFLYLLTILASAGDGPALRIEPAKEPRHVRVVARIPSALALKTPAGKLTQDQGEEWLRLQLVNGKKEGPPMLGVYERHNQELRFTPRLPLESGRTYRAHFGDATAEYKVPLPGAGPIAFVEKLYPTSNVLPANHLRFYIHFSRPMRGGQEIFDQIQILDAKGNAVGNPWLRDELWDENGQRLILYIHPGRIKFEIMLRLLFGPVLYPDREYTLVISSDMLDAEGRRLGKEYRKKFRTTAEDRVRVETDTWKVHAPAARSQNPLVLEFPKSFDKMSLERFIKVVDAQAKPVAGSIQVGAKEKSWSFQPAGKWRDAEYRIKIDPQLEDTAGNTPSRPFDLDAKAPPPSRPVLLNLRFRPKK